MSCAMIVRKEKDKQWSIRHNVERTRKIQLQQHDPIKTRGELMYSERVSRSCSTYGTE